MMRGRVIITNYFSSGAVASAGEKAQKLYGFYTHTSSPLLLVRVGTCPPPPCQGVFSSSLSRGSYSPPPRQGGYLPPPRCQGRHLSFYSLTPKCCGFHLGLSRSWQINPAFAYLRLIGFVWNGAVVNLNNKAGHFMTFLIFFPSPKSFAGCLKKSSNLQVTNIPAALFQGVKQFHSGTYGPAGGSQTLCPSLSSPSYKQPVCQYNSWRSRREHFASNSIQMWRNVWK